MKMYINQLQKSLIERGYNPEDVYIVTDPNYETVIEVYAIKSDVWVGEYDTEEEGWIDEDVTDDYYSNAPCDTYGMCAGTSCSHYYECHR